QVTHLVILIHGIRTVAEWKSDVQHAIASQEMEGADRIGVELVGYGYLDLLRFILPRVFIRPIGEDVYRKIDGWKGEYPNATRVSVIAHSLGTYVIAWVLRNTPLRLHRLILCASIIPARSDWWTVIRKSVSGGIRNDCARRDIWPALAY